jgi:hypothetical protein
MTRTQIQFPDPLYRRLKQIAEEQDWTLAEVVRRAGEHYAARFPEREQGGWEFPKPLDLGGKFLVPPESTRSEADLVEQRGR